jgi:uncharacterized RDD family membrane protein YckC
MDSVIKSTCTQYNHNYAGFFLRLFAFLIDSIILLIPQYYLDEIFLPYLESQVQYQVFLMYKILVYVSFTSLYCGIMESSFFQGTFGKMILGLRVCDEQGDRVSLLRATLRGFFTIFSWTSFGLGYVIISLTPKKQALHDIAAQCLVVRKESRSGPVRIFGIQV